MTNSTSRTKPESRTYKDEGGVQLQSPLPILPISGLTKKRRYSEIGGIGSHIYITYKTLIWDLEMGGGIGGGGGIEWGGIGGDDCTKNLQ